MYKFSLSSQGKKFEDSDQLPVCLGVIISKLLWISWRCMRFFQSLISCATLFDEHRILLIINKLWIELIQRVDLWTHNIINDSLDRQYIFSNRLSYAVNKQRCHAMIPLFSRALSRKFLPVDVKCLRCVTERVQQQRQKKCKCVFLACTWRHHFLKSKTKQPPKFLSSSGIRMGKLAFVYNVSAQ